MKNKNGFTLVELIITVSILIILSAIASVTYLSYISDTRDVKRISDIKALNSYLNLYSINKQLPLPENNINILYSGSVVSHQGLLGKDIIKKIGYKEGGLDPKGDIPYNYYITHNRKYFQLMAFLEEELNNIVLLKTNKAVAGVNYSSRFPYTKGSKLGILVGDINTINVNIPLETSIDLKNTTTPYTAILSNKYILTGTGGVLGKLAHVLKMGGKGYTINSSGELIYTDLNDL